MRSQRVVLGCAVVAGGVYAALGGKTIVAAEMASAKETIGVKDAIVADEITVAAAISLRESLLEIGKAYEEAVGTHVRFTFGASGRLAAQIKAGARLDAFISAAHVQTDDLIANALASARSRRIVARNRLALIVPKNAAHVPCELAGLTAPSVRRIAIGQPRIVPAGAYAVQAFEHAGLDEKLRRRLIYGSTVRQVLDYVVRGEVDAGIVYASDAALARHRVRLVTILPAEHEPIEYPAVVLNNAAKPREAERFIDFVRSDVAQAMLAARGFSRCGPRAATTAPAIELAASRLPSTMTAP